MAIVKPCAASQGPKNTGLDCSVAMAATAMTILMPDTAKWDAEDEEDFLAYIQTQIHAQANQRWFPLFGNKAPVRTMEDKNESDVTVTYDDGSVAFIRNGTIGRTFMTNKGGLALAKAFLSFNGYKNYAFIEIDKFNRINRMDNGDGTFSGFPLNVQYAPLPSQATLKTEFMPAFYVNYRVEDYIGKGSIGSSDQNLLDLMGLINAEVTQAAAATTTKLKIGVKTIGTDKDLVAAFPALADVSAFKVTKLGNVVTPASAAVVSGHIELTISGASTGDIYVVEAAAASVWKGLEVEGYEGIKSVSITIP